ncbi:hypothetical protein IE81DRAFT_98116 [Ceraceosorus guamensis]|uniref:Peptidase S33 tripeptidyl aminopeptidase-like C-terminal domain-containing protein n=1 Tax=Ceraceosorus guamensis TaxID=1522189 RepID=A0A316W670_9BASI|nr:hypothetical protein IE81DRAFT_98116 [Ceraceosorus guamensis]PWN43155.1 hypothetical protein IE81DRAFT_98116 [Ceraceosorus guamensis]
MDRLVTLHVLLLLALFFLTLTISSCAAHNPSTPVEAAKIISDYVAAHPLDGEKLHWAADSPICHIALSQSSSYNSSDLGPTSPLREQMDCLAISVPYTYSDPNDQRRADLAIFRLVPSQIRSGKRQSKGRIFLNPGGPGGSGSIFLAANWQHFLDRTNAEYELIGWDQRGVGQSQPSAPICFGSGVEQARFELDVQINVPILQPGTSPTPEQIRALREDVDHSLARYAEWRNGCLKYSSKDSVDFLPFIGTFYTALDLEYMRQLLAHHQDFAPTAAPRDDGIATSPDLLHYWGISYGTTIGQLYMAMFPEQTGLFILDGVVNASSSLHNRVSRQTVGDQAEAVLALEGFYKACLAAGPSSCPLSSHSKDAKHLADVVDVGLRRIHDEPMRASSRNTTFLAGQSLSNGTITLPQIEARMLSLLISPLSRLSGGYATLARILKGVVDGDADEVYAAGFRFSLDAASAGNSTSGGALPDDGISIVCQDAPSDDCISTSDALVDWILDQSIPISKYFDPVVLPSLSCSATGLDHAHERWTGPMPMDQPSQPLQLRNKALIIGNVLDPSTAGAQARALHAHLPNSSYLLIHHGAGHTSWAQPCICTHELVRLYWGLGSLPAPVLKCSAGLLPLFGRPSPLTYF